jgi:ferredoxin
MKDRKIKKVTVDEDLCLAHFLCVSEAPDVFFNKEDHWAVQLHELDEATLAKENMNILWAANVCPVAAIKVEFEDGSIVDGDTKELNVYLESTRT